MKKLFSYLLISSMVVLSSCTNYDDQFDDLNTQINSLKSQIEGFSSLSSGLTALQGTVSGLQAAVAALPQTATPATDISGLEAAVAELQAALSGAATSAEVAALTADLAATQAALDASISANATATASAQTALEAALATAQASNTTATDALAATLADLEAELAAAATAEEVAAISTAIAANQAALVLAIGENSTATADNATEIEALAASLEALTATIAEIQASLATVSTAEEVAALAADLAAAQADLTSIIASSSFYDGTLTINSQATLDFAVSLGDKVKFIRGGLTIDQDADEDMDAVQLTAIMAKVLNVTGAVSYTSTSTETTKGSFTNLTGAGGLTISQSGNISLPKLAVVTDDVSISGSENTETVSLPLLTSVTDSTPMVFASLGDVTTFSMPSMVSYDRALTINIDNAGTIDLSAFTNATNLDGTIETTFDALTINASTLTAPVYTSGAITGNRLTSVDLPKWKYATGSSFDRASTVVLPSVDPGKATSSFTIDIEDVFDSATSVHIVAAPNTHTGVLASEHVNVGSTSTKLESLILGGTFTTIDISGSDVTSITFDGTAHSVTVIGTDIETLDLPYTSAAKGVFAVTNNTKLASVSADKINGLSSFTLTGNEDLTDISFDALDEAGATGATVAISGNDLDIESVSDAQTAPVVAKKVISSDFAPLKDFLADAIDGITATSGTQVMVSVDTADVARAYDADGDERDVVSSDAVLANYDYLAVADNSTGNVAKVEEMYITSLSGDATFQVASVQADGTYGTAESVSIIAHTGLEDYYDIKNWADAATTTAALSAAGVEIVSYGKGQKSATFEFADATLTNVSAVVTFADGGVETVSVTTGSASNTTDIAEAIALALASGDGVVSQYYTVTNAASKKLTFSSNAKGSHRQSFNLAMTAQVLSGSVGATAISFATASKLVANSIESTAGAYVQFRSTNAGVTGARNITLINANTATLLTASGISTAHAGDDETFTAAETGTANTLDNSVERAAVSINNVQYVAGA